MLFRFDPFDEIDRMTARRTERLLAMDATRTDDEIVVYLDAPGVRPEHIEVTAEQGTLTIEAQRRWFDADASVLVRERLQGHFRRQLQVGDAVDLDRMSAKFEHGVIVLALPIAETAKPRKVTVEASDSAPALETSTS